MLFSVLKDILCGKFSAPPDKALGELAPQDCTTSHIPTMRKVLNVGGNNKNIPIPSVYDGWQQVLLDIDATGNPDVVCDARALTQLAASQYDAIYCSHNLEHYYRHEVAKVLAGFHHVLKEDGFIQIQVPDMSALMKRVVDGGLDIDDFLYTSPAGPIHVIDVIYGYGVEIERSGNDFFAHKTGFTQTSLVSRLKASGFSSVFSRVDNLNIDAIAFKSMPTKYAVNLFQLPPMTI